ncbi:MAG TPA: CBS domain-containing protein [Candidatus Dormibacteraeota bacterium]|nr:CBS domain-containing protein [Candidatus Dormibacteraeota bacterium]
MKVRDLPPGPLLSVEPETTIAEVARQMRNDDSDSIAVMSEGRLVGIITERDLVKAIADGVDPQQARADVVMTGDPATVDADEDVAMVAVKMMRLGVRHLPVVNKAGKPVGLVSARNLVAILDRGTH